MELYVHGLPYIYMHENVVFCLPEKLNLRKPEQSWPPFVCMHYCHLIFMFCAISEIMSGFAVCWKIETFSIKKKIFGNGNCLVWCLTVLVGRNESQDIVLR